jgi:hypothetical protein
MASPAQTDSATAAPRAPCGGRRAVSADTHRRSARERQPRQRASSRRAPLATGWAHRCPAVRHHSHTVPLRRAGTQSPRSHDLPASPTVSHSRAGAAGQTRSQGSAPAATIRARGPGLPSDTNRSPLARRSWSQVWVSPRPASFTGGHPNRVRAGGGRWRTPANVGQHCWKACKGEPFRFESPIPPPRWPAKTRVLAAAGRASCARVVPFWCSQL